MLVFCFSIFLILIILIHCLETCSASLRKYCLLGFALAEICIKHTSEKKKKKRKKVSPVTEYGDRAHLCHVPVDKGRKH